jgi:hypothetical protein
VAVIRLLSDHVNLYLSIERANVGSFWLVLSSGLFSIRPVTIPSMRAIFASSKPVETG